VKDLPLRPGRYIDSDHPAVSAFAQAHKGPSADPREQVVALYYAIRDGWRYNPWGVAHIPDAFRASAVLTRDRARGGHCIDKATVLAASARALGVPARLHFANVRNHIGTADLEARLGTDLLVFHGYAELYLGEPGEPRWVAATPAFNKGLCDKLGVAPLEFDGRSDSVFQEYDHAGGRFMEYVHDYGTFDDLPYEVMVEEWRKYYPVFAVDGVWPSSPQG
jgi:transglutaminase-like putative cysteine protease